MDIGTVIIFFLWVIALSLIGFILGELYRRTKKMEKNIDKIMTHLKIE
jgi:hypothetical protein